MQILQIRVKHEESWYFEYVRTFWQAEMEYVVHNLYLIHAREINLS